MDEMRRLIDKCSGSLNGLREEDHLRKEKEPSARPSPDVKIDMEGKSKAPSARVSA